MPNYYTSMLYAAEAIGHDAPTMEDLAGHLAAKLLLAVSEQGGYGLDAVAASGGGGSGPVSSGPGPRSTLGGTGDRRASVGRATRPAARNQQVRPCLGHACMGV